MASGSRGMRRSFGLEPTPPPIAIHWQSPSPQRIRGARPLMTSCATRTTVSFRDRLIALGGQLGEFAGFMPGVAEEIAVALEAGLAVYVLGGFGGAAEQVAAVISGGILNI